MDKTRWNEVQAVILFAIALLILISLVSFSFSDIDRFTSKPNVPVRNFAGLFGVYVGAVLFFIMGLSSYCIPLLVLSWAVSRLSGVKPQKAYFKIFGTFFLILASSSIFSMMGKGDNSFRFSLGGAVGLVFSDFLVKYLGRGGAILVIAVLFLLSILLATEFLLLPFLAAIFTKAKAAIAGRRLPKRISPTAAVFNVKRPVIRPDPERTAAGDIANRKPFPKAGRPDEADVSAALKLPVINVHTPVSGKAAHQGVLKADGSARGLSYALPVLDLLESPPPIESRKIKEDFEGNARILEETLGDFDIEAKVVEINKGPVITRYELEPAPGVKIHRITSLGDNIALAMKAQSIRMVAPVPGKGTVGVEVPNSQSALVYLREVLESKEYAAFDSKLKLAIGKDIAGESVIADLATMPHLLIAGATGSGKTVCVNTIITSILFNAAPDEVKFIMIDPKRVELAVFNDLPHLLSPVVTDAKKAASTLEWVVGEMDSRYELFAQAGVRNIDLYNERFGSERRPDAQRALPQDSGPVPCFGKLSMARSMASEVEPSEAEGRGTNGERATHDALRNAQGLSRAKPRDARRPSTCSGLVPSEVEGRTTKLPYIVIVIDELADLMMVAQADVEGAITRLAQLSRAVGIHIVIATQRPSVDVITGIIKANFPSRISFKVASKVDSRTVLDMNGADKLLGRGDMLFVEPGAAKPTRAQCSLISDKEIERITNFIKSQRRCEYIEDILDVQKKPGAFKKFEKDEVYEEAVKIVLQTRQASVSMLQRRLGLGYTRAARLIDMMEDEGVVGPYQGSKPREILINAEEYAAKGGRE